MATVAKYIKVEKNEKFCILEYCILTCFLGKFFLCDKVCDSMIGGFHGKYSCL